MKIRLAIIVSALVVIIAGTAACATLPQSSRPSASPTPAPTPAPVVYSRILQEHTSLKDAEPSAPVTIKQFLDTAVPALTFEHGEDAAYVAVKQGYITDFEDGKIATVAEVLPPLLRMTYVDIPADSDVVSLARENGIVSEPLPSPDDTVTAALALDMINNAREAWYNRLEAEEPSPIADFSYVNSSNSPNFKFADSGNELLFNDPAGLFDIRWNLDTGENTKTESLGHFAPKWTNVTNFTPVTKTENIFKVISDHAGVARFVYTVSIIWDNYYLSQTIYYRKTDKEDFKVWHEYKLEDRQVFDVMAFTEGNETFLVKTNLYDNYISLYEMSPETRDKKLVYQNPHADLVVGNDSFDFYTQDGYVAGVTYEDDKKRPVFLSDGLKAAMDKLYGLGYDKYHYPVAISPGFERIVLFHATDTDLGMYYMFDTRDGSYRRLGKKNSEFDDSFFVRAYPVSFKNRDGVTIFGYLRLPRGKSPRNLPLYIDVHGGPDLRSHWEEAMYGAVNGQFFANRGYASLSVDFRQSTGYGNEYYTAGNGNNILRQNDIADGTRWALAQGIADPERVGVYGASYGGYSAYYQAAVYPELYKSAIAYCGVFDWPSYMTEFKRDRDIPQYMNTIFANSTDLAVLESESPITYVNNLKARTMIIYTGADTSVYPSQSVKAIDALKAAGNEPEVFFLDGVGHVPTDKNACRMIYEAIDKFLGVSK